MKQWSKKEHDLMVGGETVDSVARRMGTPLYLYDGHMILDRIQAIRQTLPDFTLLYSVKTNPNPAILHLIAQSAIGFDVASPREFHAVRSCAPRGAEITYVGPGKRRNDLMEIIEGGATIVIAESLQELDHIESIGKELGRPIPTIVRINTLFKPDEAGEFMAGGPTQFGIDEEIVIPLLKKRKFQYVEPIGIHAHIASQVLDVWAISNYYYSLAQTAKKIAAELEFDLKVINFGGGFGIPYDGREKELNLEQLGKGIKDGLNDVFSASKKPEYYLELGRFLVGGAGLFLTEIVEVKESQGVNFVITETGIAGFSRPIMPWAQQHPCSIVTKEGLPATGTYRIVGPSCLPGDVLCRDVALPDPKPGDMLAVHNAGAYGYTMSLVLWGSNVAPKEVLYYNGEFISSDSSVKEEQCRT